ncbi:nucleotide exchange factor GrpE [Euhalothece natronophila Z-M001]|uniref:Nucleotide exchange factor GrpE n=1 Tax=Euhalothece natronophila Z-M001 TaxID=522448 RepID=A0A5B8NQ31_9CHRO|nr:nucleotide exchange factor GrpE [Euhalothece natronophila]QDZ40265.1 nucleotide exchange factor GrpE [Euhalothece natronophila Z-M001]
MIDNSNQPSSNLEYCLTPEQREELLSQVGNLLKEKLELKQELQKQVNTANSEKEQLFLEVLELFDGLESLITYLNENPDPDPRFIKRLPKSLGTLQKKLLTILKRREVTPIDHSSSVPDYQVCQVVDREPRDDLEDNTITKVVRQGFWLNSKVLRPLEVITSKAE